MICPKSLHMLITDPEKPIHEMSDICFNVFPIDVAGMVDVICSRTVFDQAQWHLFDHLELVKTPTVWVS